MVTKGADWVRDYYALECHGEYLVELVSRCLFEGSARPRSFVWEPSALGVSFADHIDRTLRGFLEPSYSSEENDTFIQSLLVEEVNPAKALITVDICQKRESSNRHLSIRMEAGYASIHQLDEGMIRILEWKQYQDPFEYESDLDLWK
jgi:hypothetical protein